MAPEINAWNINGSSRIFLRLICKDSILSPGLFEALKTFVLSFRHLVALP